MVEDLVSGFRQIRRYPAFAAAAVATLALGIGGTSAVFTLADPMLFRPLPYADADRLYRLAATAPGAAGGLRAADYLRVRDARDSAFEHVGEYSVAELQSPPAAYNVSSGFLEMLGIQPALGRIFDRSEYRVEPEPADAALITWTMWRTTFGARPDVLGQSVELRDFQGQSRRYRIVGVLPRAFAVPDITNAAPDVLLPIERNPARASSPNVRAFPIARLRETASVERATQELQRVVSSVERELPRFPRGRTARLVPLRESLFGGIRTPLLMLLGATGCVLLLACVNLAHLFAARLHSRTPEFGVRLAIGGTRWRLTRQLALESVILAVGGTAAALVVGQWTFDLIMAFTPQFAHVYRLLPAGLDGRVIAFAAALAGLALFIAAVFPALTATNTDMRASLIAGAAYSGSPGGRRRQHALIAAQAAMSVMLLVTSALIIGSFFRLAYQPLGFDPDRVTAARIALPDLRSGTFNGHRAVYEEVRRSSGGRLSLAAGVPGLTIPARLGRAGTGQDGLMVVSYPVTDTFFDVFGMTLIRGRLFSEEEAFANASVAVIDEIAAARLFPATDPLGQQTRGTDQTARTVVGIVRTVRTSLARDPEGTAFVPLGAATRPANIGLYATGIDGSSASSIQRAAQRTYPSAEIAVQPLGLFDRELGQPRFLAVLLAALGLLTMALAVVGVYGVVAHQAARRTREAGIRIALGARREQIVRLVLRDASVSAGLGVTLGVIASLWWTDTLRAVLYEIQPDDPATYALVSAGVLALVILSGLLPALGASRADPAATLRAE